MMLSCAVLSGNPVFAQETGSKVAGAADMAPVQEVTDEGLEPVLASAIEPGEYDIDVDCSSSMFPIDNCLLRVTDNGMTVTLTMGGEGYLYVYPGTAEEAAKADKEEYISFVPDEEGRQTCSFEIHALDECMDLAAFSRRKEMWYDRTLLFHASGLPAAALKGVEEVTVETLGLTDGSYLAEVTLKGGSGRTCVESPCRLTVENRQAFAEIIWPNNNYDYMIVGDRTFTYDGTKEKAVFYIPVQSFDVPLPVTVDTTALGRQTEIGYTLTFDSETIAEEGQGN